MVDGVAVTKCGDDDDCWCRSVFERGYVFVLPVSVRGVICVSRWLRMCVSSSRVVTVLSSVSSTLPRVLYLLFRALRKVLVFRLVVLVVIYLTSLQKVSKDRYM